MYLRLSASVILSAVLVVVSAPIARADDRCAVPLVDWQPPEALKTRLEQDGWSAIRIRIDDGCYKVAAFDRDGRPIKGRFDPATLERVARGEHGEHGRHRDRDDHD